MSDRKAVSELQPANLLTPLVAAGAVLTVLYLPAVMPFFSASQLANVGPWLAFLVAVVAAGIVMPQVGKWMPLCCVVTLFALTQIVSTQIDTKSKKVEVACGELQREMKIDNPHAANAAAIFTAYGCKPRWH